MMRAAIYNGKKNILLGELETPKAGEHEFTWKRLAKAIETAADVEHSLNVVIRYDR